MATKVWKSTSSTSFSTAGNWEPSGAPANGDTLVFNSSGTANVETDLSTVLTGITIVKERSYTGSIGTVSGAVWTYLVLDGGSLFYEQNTGQGNPTGSALCLINFGSTAATAVVYDTKTTSSTSFYAPLLLKGTALTLVQSGGRVGIAAHPSDVATGTFRIIKGKSSVAPFLYLGSGVTTTLLTVEAGTAFSRSSNTVTEVALDGTAIYDFQGSGTHTTLTVGPQATVKHTGTGTIGTLTLSGTFDRTADTRALAFTNPPSLYSGAKLLLDNGVVNGALTVNLVKCAIQDVDISLPTGHLLTAHSAA